MASFRFWAICGCEHPNTHIHIHIQHKQNNKYFQHIKALTCSKPDNLNLVPKTYMVEVENFLLSTDPPHRVSENQIIGKIKQTRHFVIMWRDTNGRRHLPARGEAGLRTFCRVAKGTSAVKYWVLDFQCITQEWRESLARCALALQTEDLSLVPRIQVFKELAFVGGTPMNTYTHIYTNKRERENV